MCVRARKLEPRSVKVKDRRGQEIGIALTGGLGERLYGYHRCVALAAPALAEAASGLPDELVPTEERPLPLVIAAPETKRPDDSKLFETQLLRDLAEQSDVALDVEASTVVRHGQAGFAHALQTAKSLLDERRPAVCVGGVDTYYHPHVLKWLDAGYRLHAVGADSGFVPSEGASFLVLSRLPKSAERLGRILDVEVGEEKTAASEDEPNIGEAMTVLLESVQERLGVKVPWTITDYNGERHRYREWELARGRTVDREAIDTHWVWETGDVGAASGPLFTTIALLLCRLGCAPARQALLALHAEAGERGVVVFEGAEGASDG
jgi:3-oxoacyl-[acyl-carrier-protein] synthase-1